MRATRIVDVHMRIHQSRQNRGISEIVRLDSRGDPVWRHNGLDLSVFNQDRSWLDSASSNHPL